MRIISGRYARRTLAVPKGLGVRPTADRVREALFSALESRGAIAGARVLDLFAGSGALGLEALSRGAAAGTFVVQRSAAIAALRSNVAALDAGAEVTIVRADAMAWLRRAPAGSFDLVLADPPYDLDVLPRLPALLLPLLAPEGTLVVEHDARHDFAGADGLLWSRRYGRTVLSAFE
jgi:16S rRNA (guanine(966)-N(2))-methyltransferase RsmD